MPPNIQEAVGNAAGLCRVLLDAPELDRLGDGLREDVERVLEQLMECLRYFQAAQDN